MKKIFHLFLHGISLLTMAWIVWTVVLTIQKPSLGANWGYRTGVIYDIDPSHPSAQAFRIDDRIIQAEDLSPSELYKHNGRTTGEIIRILVERDGQILELDALVAPSSVRAILDRLPPFLVALGFWLAGSYVLAFGRSGNQANLFFLLSLSAVVALTCGAISAYGPAWTKMAFQCGILWIGAFAVHLHLDFPARMWTYKRRIGYALVAVTVLLSLLIALDDILAIQMMPSSLVDDLTFIVFGIDMVTVVLVLAQSYWKASSALERNQVGIITLSSLIGIIPLVTLILIPQLILGHPMFSANFAFLSMLFIPIGYGFAIYRYRLIGVKETINRGMALVLVALVIAGIYSIWFSLSSKYVSPAISQSAIWGAFTTLILAGLTVKLYDILIRFANNVLYGGWYDYRSVVEQARHSLTSTSLDRESVGAVLCQVIGQSMRLECVSLVLPCGMKFTYEDKHLIQFDRLQIDLCEDFMKQAGSIASENEGFLTWDSRLDPVLPIFGYKKGARPHHMVLLRSKNSLIQGVFLLGQKWDGESLCRADFDILKVVTHQAQITLENIKLLEEAREHSEKIGRMHRQVLRAREEERKRLSRDLHDTIIQSLVGVHYLVADVRVGLSGNKEEDIAKAQSHIQKLIGELRQICADLRPPTLDVLDFTEAIQTKVAEIEENASFRTRVFIEGNEEQDIDEDIRLCIYRLIQESLINVHKHAQADYVEVWVQVSSEKVSVIVTDNGLGFDVPKSLEYLITNRHFGLIGLKEMVEAVNGQLNIKSEPGQGCVLAAHIPI